MVHRLPARVRGHVDDVTLIHVVRNAGDLVEPLSSQHASRTSVLGFLVRPAPAAGTSLVTPLLSGAVTGMPPFFPPVAPCMAVELALMCGAIALVVRRWPRAHPLAVLVPVLLAGREAYAAMICGVSLVIELPGRFLAGVSLLSQG